MFSLFRKKSVEVHSENVKDNSVSVFVDFDYWSQSLVGRFSKQPQVAEWLEDVTKGKECLHLYFFGELDEARYLSDLTADMKKKCNIIETDVSERQTKKGTASTAMISQIYEILLSSDVGNEVVLFTGDGNYKKLMKTLMSRGKTVTLYYIRGVVAEILPHYASEAFEIPKKKKERNEKNLENMILKSLSFLKESEKQATYGKTITNVAKHNHVPNKKVQAALDHLIEDGYVILCEKEYEGKKVPTLTANWEKLIADQMWENRD